MTRTLARLALLIAAACGAGAGTVGEPAAGEVAGKMASLRAAYSGPPASWPRPWLDPGIAFVELDAPAPLPPPPPSEADLGARLFGDPRLSADGRVSCASCHDPAHGFSVADKVGRGVGGMPGRRNPPALHGLDARGSLDWDGGGPALPARLLAPLTDPKEMGAGALQGSMEAPECSKILIGESLLPDRICQPTGNRPGSLDDAMARLAGTGPGAELARLSGDLAPGTLARVLAAYLATIDGETRFDRFIRGDATALDDTELNGLHLFRTKARCANCHFGPQLSDGRFHNLRLSFFGEPAQDLGRYEVTGAREDAGRFRTASLRHVGDSAPYMHNGLFPTLAGVVNFYDRGGGEVWARNAAEASRPLYREAAQLSAHIRPLGLSPQEKAALVAFLGTL